MQIDFNEQPQIIIGLYNTGDSVKRASLMSLYESYTHLPDGKEYLDDIIYSIYNPPGDIAYKELLDYLSGKNINIRAIYITSGKGDYDFQKMISSFFVENEGGVKDVALKLDPRQVSPSSVLSDVDFNIGEYCNLFIDIMPDTYVNIHLFDGKKSE